MRDSDRQSPLRTPAPPHQRAPAQANDSDPSEDAQRHLHRIAVETGSEPVFLTIGRQPEGLARYPQIEPAEQSCAAAAGGSGHAPIAGGFSKLFNRVIDSGAWAGLPEAARAVYVPMVRFAEGREGYRVRIGLAALMRYTRLSRSSVKRALRALLEARLIAIVRAGGVAPDGTNRTNIYQLLLPEQEATESTPVYGGRRTPALAPPGAGMPSGSNPARAASRVARHPSAGPARTSQSAARAKRGSAVARGQGDADGTDDCEGQGPAQNHPWFAPGHCVSNLQAPVAFTLSSWAADPVDPLAGVGPHGDLSPGSSSDPLPARTRPPAPGTDRPPPGLSPVPAGGRGANPAGGPLVGGTGTHSDPLHRANKSNDISDEVDDDSFEFEEMMPEPEPSLSEEQRQLRTALEAWGVDWQVAGDVVRDYDRRQIARAIALARQAKARGGLVNPAGYIVRCLDGLQGGANPARDVHAGGDLPGVAQSDRRAEEGRALAARASADARLDDLDEQTLAHLAARVLAMHADRPSMLRLLSARPPRESRLMRAEIAALLEV